ncbi:Hsp70 family protein [Nocardia sp. NBC_00565]|uniref:Hsp70 family protein n=1 Tax=Nocardia sp. NBC_00565 TaxID=2975993 RepID=UPI002E81A3F8|nr:Hsp70 family protein [Nocardia sp. NBC_00565]WUC06446.1 Hsp70 family protein [Nocardia sp. NBC_00565]
MAPTLSPLGSGAGPVHPGLVVTGFVDRVGDPIDLIAADGSAHRPADLVARAVQYLTRYSAGAFAGPPTIAATYPSYWKPQGVRALREALDQMDMTGVALVDEVGSILAQVESTRGLPSDGAVVVYDLGGNGLSVSVARGTEQIGRTVRNSEFGGKHIDDAILRQVLRGLDGELGDVDLAAPALLAPLNELRRRCQQAKETLSTETAAVVEVELGRVRHDVRLVRSELEDLIREQVVGSAGLVREALHTNEIDARDVRAVVLAGGAAATPLVAEVLSAEFHVPVIAEPDPGLTSANGAALLARSSVRATTSVPVPPPSMSAPTSATAPQAPEPPPSTDPVASKPPVVVAPANTVAPGSTGGGEKVGSRRRKRAFLAAAAIATLAAAIVGIAAHSVPKTEPQPAVNEQVHDPAPPAVTTPTPLPYPTRHVS